MKRFLSIITITLVAISVTSCNWFNRNEKQDNEQPTVESYIESDMEYVRENYGNTFVWYETEILYTNYLDEENDGTYQFIKSVYQYVDMSEDSISADVKVITIYHENDAVNIEVEDTWYAECFDLRHSDINLTFRDAYNAIMSVNLPKPHTQYCVLRDQVGPVAANPQYIYGQGLLFVDAVNGLVSEINPVFPNATEESEN